MARNTHPHTDDYHYGLDYATFIKLASTITAPTKSGTASIAANSNLYQYLSALADLVTNTEVERRVTAFADAVKLRTTVAPSALTFSKVFTAATIENPFNNSSRLDAIIHDGTRWVAAGMTNTGSGHAILVYAVDPVNGFPGIGWQISTEVFNLTNTMPLGLAFNGSRYVVVGQSRQFGTATSVTASSWTRGTIATTGNWPLTRVTFGNGLWVVTADASPSGSGATPQYATSTDGSSWTVRTAPFGGGTTLTGIAYNDGVWAMTGYRFDSGAGGFTTLLTTNPDPTNAGGWTTRWTGSVGDLLTDVGVANGQWMAVGQAAGSPLGAFTLISTSPASSNWTYRDIRTDVPITPKRVAYGAHWVIVGFGVFPPGSPISQTRVYYAAEPSGTWQSASANLTTSPSGSNNWLADIAFAAETYVAVGDYNLSSNGRGGATVSGRVLTAPTLDARIVITGSAGLTADSTIRATVSGSLTADATVVSSASGSFTADAMLSAVVLDDLTADAVLRAINAGSVSADAFVAGGFTGNAVISVTGAGSLTANAVIRATFAGSATSDGFIAGHFTADARITDGGSTGDLDADAVILRTSAGSVTADAAISATASGSFTANAVILRTISGSASGDSVVLRIQTGSFTANAVIRRTQTGSFTGNAFIPGRITADAVIEAGGGSEDFQSDAFQSDAFE